jgi:hypothetical protein
MKALQAMEQIALAEGREWTRRRLSQRLQAAAEQIPLVNAQGEPLGKMRWRPLRLQTVVGVVELKVGHGYDPRRKRWVCPARQEWGLAAYQRVTPELQARLCHTATVVGSYQGAAELAARWGTEVSDDLIHQQVQRVGAQAADQDLRAEPVPEKEPEFSLVIMMDGWMARERGPDWGASARKTAAERVEWREIKSAVIYRMDQAAQTAGGRGLLVTKHVVACAPETDPVDFGQAVQAEALRRGLGRARKVYVVIDGAVWLWALTEARFQEAIKILDFHHAREHLLAVGQALHGENPSEVRAWADPLVRQLRRGQEARVLRTLEQLLGSNSNRTPQTQKTLLREVDYFRRHAEHLHYRRWARAGAPIGSGAVESLGAQLQRRLRGCGMFWMRPGLTHLLALVVAFKNHDEHYLWN